MHESITVSALNRYAKALIESDEVLSQVWVEGEISGFKLNQSSGHLYFALKDAQASVSAVMWSSAAARLRFIVKDGMYVVARCKVSLYERDGRFQLYVDELVPRGVGTLQQQLEALRDKLAREGLFDEARKRPLVPFPHHIAIITSPTAAALQDIRNVVARRYPFVRLTLFPATVQGQLAVPTVVAAIRAIEQRDDIDEVIITRGGGSKEDLFCFNSEEIVRAAAALRVPFISAVGHEIDVTLLDLAADMRAPTPSAAAELAVPDAAQLLLYIDDRLAAARQRVRDGVLANEAALRDALRALHDAWDTARQGRADALAHRADLLDSLNPAGVLARGYAGVYKNGAAVTGVRQLSPGDAVELRLADGGAVCEVKTLNKESIWT